MQALVDVSRAVVAAEDDEGVGSDQYVEHSTHRSVNFGNAVTIYTSLALASLSRTSILRRVHVAKGEVPYRRGQTRETCETVFADERLNEHVHFSAVSLTCAECVAKRKVPVHNSLSTVRKMKNPRKTVSFLAMHSRMDKQEH